MQGPVVGLEACAAEVRQESFFLSQRTVRGRVANVHAVQRKYFGRQDYACTAWAWCSCRLQDLACGLAELSEACNDLKGRGAMSFPVLL